MSEIASGGTSVSVPGVSCEKREESRFSGTTDIEGWVKQGGVAKETEVEELGSGGQAATCGRSY